MIHSVRGSHLIIRIPGMKLPQMELVNVPVDKLPSHPTMPQDLVSEKTQPTNDIRRERKPDPKQGLNKTQTFVWGSALA